MLKKIFHRISAFVSLGFGVILLAKILHLVFALPQDLVLEIKNDSLFLFLILFAFLEPIYSVVGYITSRFLKEGRGKRRYISRIQKVVFFSFMVFGSILVFLYVFAVVGKVVLSFFFIIYSSIKIYFSYSFGKDVDLAGIDKLGSYYFFLFYILLIVFLFWLQKRVISINFFVFCVLFMLPIWYFYSFFVLFLDRRRKGKLKNIGV